MKKHESNFPPKIHNLFKLHNATNLNFAEEDVSFLVKMNDFQLEGRYPDYKQRIYKTLKAGNTKSFLNKADKIRTCLIEKLPKNG